VLGLPDPGATFRPALDARQVGRRGGLPGLRRLRDALLVLPAPGGLRERQETGDVAPAREAGRRADEGGQLGQVGDGRAQPASARRQQTGRSRSAGATSVFRFIPSVPPLPGPRRKCKPSAGRARIPAGGSSLTRAGIGSPCPPAGPSAWRLREPPRPRVCSCVASPGRPAPARRRPSRPGGAAGEMVASNQAFWIACSASSSGSDGGFSPSTSCSCPRDHPRSARRAGQLARQADRPERSGLHHTKAFEKVFRLGRVRHAARRGPDPFAPECSPGSTRSRSGCSRSAGGTGTRRPRRPPVEPSSALNRLSQARGRFEATPEQAEALRAFATGTSLFREQGLIGEGFFAIPGRPAATATRPTCAGSSARSTTRSPASRRTPPRWIALRKIGGAYVNAYLDAETARSTARFMPSRPPAARTELRAVPLVPRPVRVRHHAGRFGRAHDGVRRCHGRGADHRLAARPDDGPHHGHGDLVYIHSATWTTPREIRSRTTRSSP